MSVARGPKSSGGTDFVTGFTILASEMNFDLNALVTGVNNITIADANVVGGANIDPSKIGDYSDTPDVSKTTAPPATRGHSDTVTATGFGILTTSLATTLEEEIQRLRYFWKNGFAGIIDNTTGLPVASEWYAPVEKGTILGATGMIIPYFGTTAPSGWVKLDDGTIGNSASGATNRASYDTRELFRMLWRMFPVDADAPVSGGRGADPDADFNVNKTIRLPRMAGRLLGISGTPTATNITSAIAGTCRATGTTTTLICRTSSSEDAEAPMGSEIVGYTVTMRTGTAGNIGQARTISAYAPTTCTITVGSAFPSATANGDTFDIVKVVDTRAFGALVGTPDIFVSGDQTVSTVQSVGSDTATTGLGFAGTSYTNYPPTFFINWICKL